MSSFLSLALLFSLAVAGIVAWVAIRRVKSINRRRQQWMRGSDRY